MTTTTQTVTIARYVDGKTKADMPRPKVYTSRQWMWNKYVKDRMSEEEIAALAGCDQATINRWLKKLELKK